MSRLETKHPRRAFPTLMAGGANPFSPASAEPGSPRAIARRLAFEGAARLARMGAPVGSPALADVGDDDGCPLARRRAAWQVRLVGRPVVACIALLLLAGPARSQVSSASTAALGMGENYTAAARGLDAVAWNPSSLGLARDRGPSFVALAVRGARGLGPVSLGSFADWSDAVVPVNVKRDWLDRIIAEGGQTGSGGADVTWAALRLGPVAFHASSSARVLTDVSPGVAELILFGNVGEAGETRALDLNGSSLSGWAFSAVGASAAVPIRAGSGAMALGLTVKYVIGHAMALGDNSSGAASTDPVAVALSFPLVHSSFDAFSFDGGHGVGMDVGASWESGDWTLAGVVQNVVSGFAWDVSKLRYRPLSLSLDASSATTETGDQPLASAPAAVVDRVAALGFEPVFAGGLAWRYAWDLTFTADARFTAEDGLLTGPARHLGGGFEYYVADWFPVRAGAAAISLGEGAGGWQAAGGFGLETGSWTLAASVLRRTAGRFGTTTFVMFSLFGIGR